MKPCSPFAPLLALIGAILVLALDTWTKHRYFDREHTFRFLNGWIQSTLHHNRGIAFNSPIPQGVILAFTCGICAVVIWMIWRMGAEQIDWRKQTIHSTFTQRAILLGVLLGGALGNAWDRWHFGFVRDWLLLWFRSAINIADVAILVGLLGLAIQYQQEKRVIPPSDSFRTPSED